MDLIYLLSFGREVYHRMTDICIASLRGPGRFSGDILVVTDGSYVTSRPDVDVCDASGLLNSYVCSVGDQIVPYASNANTVSSDQGPVGSDDAVRAVLIKGMKSLAAPLIDHTR
ncbi:hypothetical protein [Streptomyces chattanoogensis]|uniref:hypothetical protein n=1 Tax=Streptomyces chattanoogensis TaxID=66876 RepID=UPI0036CF7EBC